MFEVKVTTCPNCGKKNEVYECVQRVICPECGEVYDC